MLLNHIVLVVFAFQPPYDLKFGVSLCGHSQGLTLTVVVVIAGKLYGYESLERGEDLFVAVTSLESSAADEVAGALIAVVEKNNC